MVLDQLAALSQNCQPTGDRYLDDLFERDKTALYYRYLHRVSQLLGPSQIVELGVYNAWSTAHFAAPSPLSAVFAVDPAPQSGFRAVTDRYPNIKVVLDRSDNQAVLNMFPSHSLDICFIDTIHEYEQATREISLWAPKMRTGGIFFLDDIDLNSGMRRFWTEVPFPKASLPWLHFSGFGIAVVC